jgi:hypothetical protein
MIPLAVISTAIDWDTGRVCRASVAKQNGGPWRHMWRSGDGIDWETTQDALFCGDTPRTALEGVVDMVAKLTPETIVVWLDGDDWLSTRDALATIHAEYTNDVWATWGGYMTSDGKRGEVRGKAFDRRHGWGCGHPKTFRAGLFTQIASSDLMLDEGLGLEWIDRCLDMLIMFPILEMAGMERCREITDVLYTYDYGRSFERNASTPERDREKRIERMIRARPKYPRLERAPW